ncbi:MAG: DUF2461 domain-containing protein [Chlorobi bacterium]|nr:DUF2461 domain-containing protein [Chlorobiota bacterium]
MEEILSFLSALKLNNNREWFNAEKERYKRALKHFEAITGDLIQILRGIDKHLPDLEPKKCIFRIYRDVRFSADKSPYKTHFGALVSEGGKKMVLAGYYLHIEPGASILGGGIYRPPSEILRKIRRDIYENPEEFSEIVEDKLFLETFGGLEGEKLVRPPQGFSGDSSAIEWLKFKSYTIIRNFSDEEVCAPDFIPETGEIFGRMTPLIHFLNYAINN